MQALRRILALLLLVLFLPGFWALLSMNTVRTTVVRTEFLQSVLADSGVYQQVPALVAAQVAAPLRQSDLPLTPGQAEAMVVRLLTPEQIRLLADPLVAGVVDWLHSDRELPQLELDLSGLKPALARELPPLLRARWDALPECTPQQLRALAGTAANSRSLPACRPPGPAGEQLWARLSQELDPQQLLAPLPDRINLLQPEAAPQAMAHLQHLRNRYQTISRYLQWQWVALLVWLGLLGLLGWGRPYSPLGWIGTALLLCALPLLLAQPLTGWGLDQAGARLAAGVPGPQLAVIKPLLGLTAGRIAAALRLQGLWLALPGAAAVAAALVLHLRAQAGRPPAARG